MNAPHAAVSSSVRPRRRRALRFVLRLAAPVAVGFVAATIGYFEFRVRLLALHSPWADVGLLINHRVSGYAEFCAASIYAAYFGLVTRRTSGRLTGAVVAWLATLCAGMMIAGTADPVKRGGAAAVWAGAVGGFIAGIPIAPYIFLSGISQEPDDKLKASRFSLKALLWIVLGFAVLFGALQLRGEYERRRHRDLIRDAAKLRAHLEGD